ncbi:MAG: cytochrome c peroxidase [Sphingobacteriales bacterium]|jgi:cytochrome c peroxidase
MTKNWIGLILCTAIAVCGCTKEKEEIPTKNTPVFTRFSLPVTPFDYAASGITLMNRSGLLANQDNTPSNNDITPWAASLGRVLFYDKTLSKNRTLACASCHQQEFGFSDTARLSVGFDGEKTGRHSMGLSNARFHLTGRFFWDERASTLEEQVLQPIQDPIEMGLTLDTLVHRISTDPDYTTLFELAFPNEQIDTITIAKALAQFVRSLTSLDSKFEQQLVLAGNPKAPFPGFSPAENNGKRIFFDHPTFQCASCHFTRGFVTDVPRNNGINDLDPGAYIVNNDPNMRGAFKTPSLINVAIRPPYMHNGTLSTLEQVVEHYNSGLENQGGSLDPHLVDVNDRSHGLRLNLSDTEKQNLIAFLHTLSDQDLLSNPAYASPFPN